MRSAPTSKDLLERSQRELPAALSLLRDMVEINSYTLNPAGINTLGDVTAAAFEPLGFQSRTVESENPKYGRHLVLSREGSGIETIAFISHLDTVFPPEEEKANDFCWREDGDRIYGPGTVDIKGGTVMVYQALTVLRDLAPDLFEQVNWQFFLNSSEEVASPDFGRLCREQIPPGALAALVVEGGGTGDEGHALVRARKGRAVFRVETHGRGAHAGNLHERGVNAITQLAHTIQRIEALTDHQAELTFNVGRVSGGSVVNRVPHHAVADLEMRGFDPAAFEAGRSGLLALQNDVVVRSLEDGYACKVEIQQLSETPPWPRNEGSDRLFELLKRCGADLGLKIVGQSRGGVSDGNHVCANVPTIDGLGPFGDNAHCSERSADGSKDQEFVRKDSFVPAAALTLAGVLRLLDSSHG